MKFLSDSTNCLLQNNRFFHRARRTARALLTAALFLCMFFVGAQSSLSSQSVPQNTSHSAGKIVKIGFIDHDDSFTAVDDDGVKSGYAYEYLQFLAYYSDLRYEYVYGDFPTLREKLRDRHDAPLF